MSGVMRNHKLIWLLLAAVMVFSGASAAQASVRKVRAGYFKFDRYHVLDPASGERSGYGYDYLQKIAKYTNWNYEYSGYDKTLRQMVRMLASGEIDLLTFAERSPENMKLLAFSEKPIGSRSGILSVRAGDRRFSMGDYKSLDGAKIGLLKNGTQNAAFRKFAETNGFSYQPTYFENNDELYEALHTSRIVDGIVTTSLRHVHDEWIEAEFDHKPFYAAVRKGDDALLKELNYAIEQLSVNVPSLQRDLMKKYYSSACGSAIPYTAEERLEMDRLSAQDGTLRVLVRPGRRPLSYSADGVPRGIIPRIGEEALKRAGIKYRYIGLESPADYERTLKSGEWDIALAITYDLSRAERSGIKLSEPYLTAPLSILKHADISPPFRSIGCLTETKCKLPPSLMIKETACRAYFNDLDECVEAVKNGKIEAALIYDYSAQQAIYGDIKNQLSSKTVPNITESFSIGVSSSSNHLLLPIIDKALASIPHDFIDNIVLEETAQRVNPFSLVGYFYANPVIAVILLAIIVLSVLIIICHLFRRDAARLTKEKNLEFERFISYVCQMNNEVIEVDLVNKKRYAYCLTEGGIDKREIPFVQMDQFLRLMHPDDAASLEKLFSQASIKKMVTDGGLLRFECRLAGNDDAWHWYDFSIKGMKVDLAHPGNYMRIVRNIDESKKAEEEKRLALADALSAATRASQAKSLFMSRMSHEIRTPLNGVIGYLNIALSAKENPDKVFSCIAKSESAAKQLLSIINDVLDISSIESGRLKIADKEFDFRQLISNISQLYYGLAKQKDVHFETKLTDLSEEWLIGDQLRINQILHNLLSNALKFTPTGGSVTLRIRQIATDDDIVRLCFEVSDSGIGMNGETLARLFQPFEQGSAEIAQKFGGTGLGLSICRNLVEMMHGKIKAESELGKGSQFTVWLSLKKSDKSIVKLPEREFSSLRALVADDEESACEYMKMMLDRCGIACDVVNSGEAAIKQIRRRAGTEYKYDICLMDLKMSGVDGIEAAKRIRGEQGTEMPIIIVTAYDCSDIEEQAIKAGVDRVIPKPVFQSALLNLLMTYYGKYVPRAEAAHTAARELSGLKILVAEDNDMNLEIAQEVLAAAGIETRAARNGAEAVGMFTASAPGDFDAILMDVQMPEMDGYEAVRRIRASSHPSAKKITIIAMTANAFAEDVAEALAAGMNDHVSKPINIDKLFAALKKYNHE